MVAEILKQIIEDDQFVFRYGGDKFVVLLQNVKREQAKNLAQDVASNWIRPVPSGTGVFE